MGMIRFSQKAALTIAIFLAAQSEAQDIRGKVIHNSDHQPVAGTRISVKDKPQFAAVTGSEGTYDLKNVGPGVFTIIAENARFYPAIKQDVSTGATADFELVEKTYKYSNQANVIIEADVSADQARHLLPAAHAARDVQAVFLLSNRLLADNPADQSLQKQSSEAQAELNRHKAQIAGSVTDKSGAVVPSVDVKVTNEVTGDTVETKTDGNGQYQTSVFPVGSYKVSVASHGEVLSSDTTSWVTPRASVTKDMQISPH